MLNIKETNLVHMQNVLKQLKKNNLYPVLKKTHTTHAANIKYEYFVLYKKKLAVKMYIFFFKSFNFILWKEGKSVEMNLVCLSRNFHHCIIKKKQI